MQATSSYMGQRLQAFKPAQRQQAARQQLQIVAKDSRIGKMPIPVPAKVQVTVDGQTVKVKVRGGSRRAQERAGRRNARLGWRRRPADQPGGGGGAGDALRCAPGIATARS